MLRRAARSLNPNGSRAMLSFYLSDPIASNGGVRADRIPRLLCRIAFLRERPILVLHYGGFDRRRKDNTRADEIIVVDNRQKQRRLDASPLIYMRRGRHLIADCTRLSAPPAGVA
jgi:hypothetical protein